MGEGAARWLQPPLQVGQPHRCSKTAAPESQRLKKLRAPLVVFLRLGMLAPIHFDDQLVLKAAKVSQELAQRILAAQSGAGQRLAPWGRLQFTFGVGRIAARSAGALTCDWSQPPARASRTQTPILTFPRN